MATYHSEHARSRTPSPSAQHRARRPDLSTFFTTLSEISTDPNRTREHAVPVPGDVAAAYRSLAEAFQVMRRDLERGGVATGEHGGLGSHGTANGSGEGEMGHEFGGDTELLGQMIEALMGAAERPPREVEGVDEEYIGKLDRVNVKKVAKDKDCPICGNAFNEDPHPLLVRLPCHDSHIFDLECIRPWLLLRGTCPLDRINLAEKERQRKKKLQEEIKKGAAADDEEEEWDGMYG